MLLPVGYEEHTTVVATSLYNGGTVIGCNCEPPPSVDIIGGKASNLFKLKGFCVPPWFVIPVGVFKSYLTENDISPLIQELEILCKDPEKNRVLITSAAEKIKYAILHGEFPTDIKKDIANEYRSLVKETGETNCAVRSSGVIEDSETSSCAGLYDTALNLHDEEEIIRGIKEVWASSFNLRIIQERIRLGISQHQCMMGVIVQELINADVAGVVSTIVLGNNYPGIQITANYGMGVSVVDGEISPDSWVLHQKQRYILEAFLGSKERKIALRSDTGIMRIPVDEMSRKQFCLTEAEIQEIGRNVADIKKLYGCEVDVEFALDARRKLFILQARPLVAVKSDTRVIDVNDLQDRKPIARGNFSVAGVASGELVYVPDWESLSSGKKRLSKGDIAIAYVTTNTWSQHLANIGGLITCEGSPSSHPILLCREKGVPCVIGIGEEPFKKLLALNGQSITLDGHNQLVYPGVVTTKQGELEDLIGRFKPVQIRKWPDINQLLPSLIHNKMVIEQEEKYWRKTPTFPIVGFQAELNLNRFNVIGELLGKPHLKIEARQIDGFICSLMSPFEEYVALFDGMTLQSVRDFHRRQRECMEEYLKVSSQFVLDPTIWKKYIELFTKLRAYIWLGGGLRAYIERKIDLLGIALELPAYYLDECAHSLQKEIPELDTEMQQEIYDLAKEMVNGEHIPVQDVVKLKESNPELFHKIELLAKKYRFEHQISLHIPTDLNLTYKRLLTEIEHIRSGYTFTTNKNEYKAHQFLPNTDLRDWLYLSIENRLLQSDAHHLDSRSKAVVRPKLLDLGAKVTVEKIFDASIEEIASYMEQINA